jgi:hypothetical protein
LELPNHLIESIKTGQAILILGAGASRSSLDRNGQPLKLGNEFAITLAKIAGLQFKGERLAEVAQAAQRLPDVSSG